MGRHDSKNQTHTEQRQIIDKSPVFIRSEWLPHLLRLELDHNVAKVVCVREVPRQPLQRRVQGRRNAVEDRLARGAVKGVAKEVLHEIAQRPADTLVVQDAERLLDDLLQLAPLRLALLCKLRMAGERERGREREKKRGGQWRECGSTERVRRNGADCAASLTQCAPSRMPQKESGESIRPAWTARQQAGC